MRLLGAYNYSKTIKKCAKRTLILLFIFIESNQLEYSPELAQLWFYYAKPKLLSGWKMARKTLQQFEELSTMGDIIPGNTTCYKARKIDLLPDWCCSSIHNFLDLKKRESFKKSTIDMYGSACVRFCEFIVSRGIKSFAEIEAKDLNAFNLEDSHNSLEGKNAYNTRIRNFLIYLEEEGEIHNQYLHLALQCVSARREGFVEVLNEKELDIINSYQNTMQTSLDSRRYAMVLLGLKMGLRSSDVVKIRFQDINWTTKTIRVVQQKTNVEEILPMPIKVGNAIYTYIKNDRPLESISDYIFIHHRVPYGRLSPVVCSAALDAVLASPHSVSKGFHITRKTFATRLLNSGVTIQTIADFLGHQTCSNVNTYLSLDEKKMKRCTLSFEETSIPKLGGEFLC